MGTCSRSGSIPIDLCLLPVHDSYCAEGPKGRGQDRSGFLLQAAALGSPDRPPCRHDPCRHNRCRIGSSCRCLRYRCGLCGLDRPLCLAAMDRRGSVGRTARAVWHEHGGGRVAGSADTCGSGAELGIAAAARLPVTRRLCRYRIDRHAATVPQRLGRAARTIRRSVAYPAGARRPALALWKRPSNTALTGNTYGSCVSTKSHWFTPSTWPGQTWSYRESHLGAGKGKSYDEDLRDRRAAKGLEWLVEQQLLASILDRMSASSHWCFADFACGTGRILEFISASAKIPSAVGIDISPEMLGLARARCPWATLIQGDVTADPALAPGPFDLITAFRFFLNAEPTLRSQVLTWMRMAL